MASRPVKKHYTIGVGQSTPDVTIEKMDLIKKESKQSENAANAHRACLMINNIQIKIS